ncbi:PH domain-containing protein [Kineosporia sp. R_H_3]|uniref:PH domain-containing protein n=1 Tax=Kineosporia sp. R_H_3 TaxID=1961848 RepID=UPI000B4BB95A|nr:PH domain-containing protein [Kineosporia sp. R_H_3]
MSDGTAWRRLSVRIVYLDVLRLAASTAVGGLGLALDGSAAVRPLLIGAAIGVLGALADLARWLTTSYRVTEDRVELRSGRLVRRHRTVPRDRIRTLDSSATVRHRLFGLRVLHVGSGDPESSFTLDALPVAAVTRLQQELGAGSRPVTGAGQEPDDVQDVPGTAAATGTVIARLRPSWVAYNAVTPGAVLVLVGPLLAAYGFLRPFGVDLLDVGRGLLDRVPLDRPWALAACVAVALPLGVAGQAARFAVQHRDFTLSRVGTPPKSALVTRRGLLSTRTVHQDDARLRGLALTEPLAWRWLRLARTTALATGLSVADVMAGGSPASSVLPRMRREEALAVGARILTDGARPLEAPLARHPRSALTGRLLGAVAGSVVVAVVLLALGRAGVLPGRSSGWWPAPLLLLPVTVALTVARYRALGHAVAGAYVVVRDGGGTRVTVALQRRAVVGLSVRQTLLQRLGGRLTVRFATAAGSRVYLARDTGVDQGLALVAAARPDLAVPLLSDPSGARPSSSP